MSTYARPLVALVGGPRHRWWYYEDEAQWYRAAAVAGQGWEYYRETPRQVSHPVHDDVTGLVWLWTPEGDQ